MHGFVHRFALGNPSPSGLSGFCLPSGGAVGSASDLLPPLPRQIVPCATFGEVVPGIVHPGIDLPASGQPFPIAAASDGEIVRVRVSGEGYGRTLHLALPDGREIVYSHLSSFSPAVEDSVATIQNRSGSFEVDWRPAAGRFTVLRGEWLGRSGETEDGRRILHLEVRQNGIPRNPLLTGFSWADETAPTIDALHFVPLGPTARVNGRLVPSVPSVRPRIRVPRRDGGRSLGAGWDRLRKRG